MLFSLLALSILSRESLIGLGWSLAPIKPINPLAQVDRGLIWWWCSVAKSCPTLCDLMDCSTHFPVLHYLLEFAQTQVHWVSDVIQPSHPLLQPLFSCPQSFLTSETFPMSRLFAIGGQSIGASASASVLPMNIQLISFRTDWLISSRIEFWLATTLHMDITR